METEKCTDPNHRIYTVEEIEANSNVQARRGTFVFVMVIFTFFSGFCMITFIHSLFWQDAAVVILLAVSLVPMMILVIRSPFPGDYTFVGTPEMLFICEKIEPYPDLREELCKIVAVRPVLTKAEYRWLSNAADQILVNVDDKATADALDAALKHLACKDNTPLAR